jgi:hypothetical protein
MQLGLELLEQCDHNRMPVDDQYLVSWGDEG